MRKRRTLMKRLLAIVLVVVMVFTSQNLSGIVSAMADERETFVQSEVMTYVSNVELPSNDELFAGYVDKEFYGEIATYGWSAGNRLDNEVAYNLYDFLKTEIEAIADGTSESAVITFYPESLGAEVTFENMSSDEAWAQFIEQFDMSLVFDALLHDCPYELYWFDKTIGMSYGCSISATGSAPTYTTVTIDNPYITFAVAGNYQSDDYDSKAPTVDTDKTSATSTAVENALAIVEAYDELEDYEKLVAYRDKICELVSYDTTAANAGTFSQNNDPWQLIYVFDGDTDTNVVCEGYSKAFQYLCDMTSFEFGICSYIVTGTMTGGTGAGGHMWNIVAMDDGKNYLVDITNSDAGSIGQNGGLFLAGTAGDIANGYVFKLSQDITFTYDSDTTGLWGTDTDSILILADSDYVYTETPNQLRIGEVNVVIDGEFDSAAVLPAGVSYDHGTKTITLDNANIELGIEISDNLIEAVGAYTLVLTGDNTITPVSSNASLEKNYVCVIDIDGDLTISGAGSLTIDVSGINVQNAVYGIRVWDNMVINGGIINVITGDVSGDSGMNYAVCVERNLTINEGILNATAGSATGTEYGEVGGIHVVKKMTVEEGAVVNATAGYGTSFSQGIRAEKELTSSGNIIASAGKAEYRSGGICVGIFDINGGKVVATADESDRSCGIEGDDITITDAYIEAQGNSQDIDAYNSMDVDSSVIVSRGQKTVTVYGDVVLTEDLVLEGAYSFVFDEGATLSLGDNTIVLIGGQVLSDETLEGIIDQAAIVEYVSEDGASTDEMMVVVYYGDMDAALETAKTNTGSTLTLLSNINKQLDINNGEFAIDLNGYYIKTETDDDYAVIVYGGSKLTIKDSSEDKSGLISNIGENQRGSGIYIDGATLILDGITCKGGISGIDNYSGGNLYISGSSVVDINTDLGGTVYISGALTDGADITFISHNSVFDVVAKAADGYTITESDMEKITYNGSEIYTLGINNDGAIQEFGDLTKAELIIDPDSVDYIGEEQSVIETVIFDDTTLTKDTDYTVEGTSGINVDEYTVTIKGIGNYIGTLTQIFYINAAEITVIDVDVAAKTYDGTETATVNDVSFGGLMVTDTLTAGTDYTITAEFADVNAGTDKIVTYTITLIDTDATKNYAFEGGARTYTGTTTGTIEKAAAPSLAIEEQSAEYGVENITFDITQLISGLPSDAGEVNYINGNMVSYGWDVDSNGVITILEHTTTAGSAGSMDIVVSTTNYEDATVRFTVWSEAADASDIAVVEIENQYEYTGLYPSYIEVEVRNAILIEGTDYDVEFPADAITVGEKVVTITFKGNYTGETTATYEITPKVIYPIISIKDKQYDGDVSAEIESVTLEGVVGDDDVSASWNNVTAEFSDANAADNKGVILTGVMTLTGADAGNYQLDMENVSVTGTIYNNYEAVEGIDYTINTHDWTNEDIVITAMDGYEIAPVGVTMGEWTDEFVVDVEGQFKITFLVRNSEGHISKTVSIDAKIDKTAPTGIISIVNSEFTELNTIGGFKLFFHNIVWVSVAGMDDNGVQSVEYILSDEYLDKLELLTRNDWEIYSGIELVSPSAQYVYAKISDVAGNYTYISSTGVVVYSNIEVDTSSFKYTKKSDAAVDVNVQLNGNTIDKLWLDENGVLTEVSTEYYEVAGNNITIKSTYLDELEEGHYVFEISFNPLGHKYVNGEGNAELTNARLDVDVEMATGDVSITNEEALSHTFGEDFVDVQYDTNSTGEVVVEYKAQSQDDLAYSTEKPVNVGDYTVRVTVNENKYYTEAIATADFSIVKASALTIDDVEKNFLRTVETTGNIIDISSLLPDDRGTTSYIVEFVSSEVYANEEISDDGIITFDTLVSDSIKADTFTVYVSMENYKDTTIKVRISLVDKEVVAITGVEAATGLIYDGTVKQGYTGTPISKYTGEYVITYARAGAMVSTLAEVEPIDAGDYTVTIAVPDDNAYYMGSVTLEFTIDKATPVKDDIAITLPATFEYDGNVKEAIVNAANTEIGEVTVYYYVNGQWTTTGPVNAGTYDVAVDIAESDNYKSASKVVVGQLEITPKDIAGAVVTLGDELTYNGEAQTQSIASVVVDGKTLTAADYEVTGNTGTNAGDYKLTITGKGNYAGSVTADWSIAKKSLSIVADTVAKVYGDVDPEFTYAIEGLVNGDNVNVLLKREDGENVGEYDIILDSFKGDNYDMTFTDGKLTIKARDIAGAVVTLGDALTYNGEEQTQSIASVVVDGKALTAADYEITGNTGTNAGDYKLTITGKGNFKGSVTADWSIAKKDIADAVITLDEVEYVFDGTEKTKAVVSVVVDGITLDDACYEVVGNVGTDAGEYELTVTIMDSENYTGSVKATWTIAPMEIADIEVTVDEDKTFVYNGTEQTIDVLEVVINGEALDESEYEVAGNVQKNSGEHVIIVSLTGNYSGTVEIPWTIAKASHVSDVETNVLPEESNEVSNDVEKLSDVKLPEGWAWSDEDADVTLEPGKEITVTAVYVGEDKDNYENTTMTVKITRAEKVVADEPTEETDADDKTEENPYTGDTRNTMVWLYVLVLSGLAAVVAGKKRRSVE